MTNKIRETFTTPFEQYRHREGQRFTVLRVITRENMTEADRQEYDEEALPMYKIRFEDGHETSAWPEEVEVGASLYHAAIYLIDRAYGGPEEGGWWFDYGEPQLTPDFPLPILTRTEDEAAAARDQLEEWVKTSGINKGRRDIGSVLSEGIYVASWDEGLPAPFPKERPHYE